MNNMETKFEGNVNGKKFTNREEMEHYIQALISNGVDITDLSFKTTTATNEVHEKMEEKDHVCDFRKKVFADWIEEAKPEFIKTSFMEYLVPFVNEQNFLLDSQTGEIGLDRMKKDAEEKLVRRMDLFTQIIVGAIKSGEFFIDDIKSYLLTLRDKFKAKAEWCQNRTIYFKTLIDYSGGEKYVDVYACTEGKVIYETVGGFCSAMIDIINDNIRILK